MKKTLISCLIFLAIGLTSEAQNSISNCSDHHVPPPHRVHHHHHEGGGYGYGHNGKGGDNKGKDYTSAKDKGGKGTGDVAHNDVQPPKSPGSINKQVSWPSEPAAPKAT